MSALPEQHRQDRASHHRSHRIFTSVGRSPNRAKNLVVGLVVWLCLAASCPEAKASSSVGRPAPPGVASNDVPHLVLALSGPPQMVFDWLRGSCPKIMAPDAPARAFRDDHGDVRLLATSSQNWSMVGPDLEHLTADCHPLFSNAASADPARHDDEGWIEATYTENGRDVGALLSDEWNELRHRPLTPGIRSPGIYSDLSRLYYTITEVVSHDGGRTFAPPPQIVAASADKYDPSIRTGTPQGFPTASNILRAGRFAYVFIHAQPGRSQPEGNCLFRSDNALEAQSWRAWNGHDFAVAFADPYRRSGSAKNSCTPVSFPGERSLLIRSVTWVPSARTYVAVTRGRVPASAGSPATIGIAYATSSDLFHWTRLRLLVPVPSSGSCDDGIDYPSMLGDVGQGRNFETAGSDAYLYYVRIYKEACKVGPHRDLLRRRVTLSTQPGQRRDRAAAPRHA